jgi:tRNA (guanine-N7-)-methyltransferase
MLGIALSYTQMDKEKLMESFQRIFPFEHEAKRTILYYPEEQAEISGDILEVGPGRGDLLLWLAGNYPEKRLVGIELGNKRYRKLIKRIERLGLTNVYLVRGNARIVVPKHFHTPSFERIYVLFPDPWPKNRHVFYRLLSTEYLLQLCDLLKPGGDIVLATDVQLYADWVIRNTEQVPALKNLGSPYSITYDLIPSGEQTYFEKKWRDEGRDIFYVHLMKK